MCRKLFVAAAKKLNCPIRVYPNCHPKSYIEVYIVAKTRTIILSCAQCDQPIATINVGKMRKNK